MSGLSSHEEPRYLEEHPLLRDATILPTRSLEEFVNAVRLWLDNLLPGGYVWGENRVGKTSAIRYLVENMQDLLGSPIPSVLLSDWDPTYINTSENRFFGELLRELGYAFPDAGTAAVKRRRVIDFMVQMVRDAREHRFLFFIDEAQWLSIVQFRFLVDLHNQLKKQDVRLVTILVGQPELRDNKVQLRSTRQNQLLSRFMTAEHHYQGIVGISDFATMLRALDSGSEYPRGSGTSHTDYFLPVAFRAGWRLEDEAISIWTVIEAVCRDNGFTLTEEVPVQALTALVRYLLRELAEEDSEHMVLDKARIEEAVYRVALLQLEDHAHQVKSMSAAAPVRCVG